MNLAKVIFMLKHSVKLSRYLLRCCVGACCHAWRWQPIPIYHRDQRRI